MYCIYVTFISRISVLLMAILKLDTWCALGLFPGACRHELAALMEITESYECSKPSRFRLMVWGMTFVLYDA